MVDQKSESRAVPTASGGEALVSGGDAVAPGGEQAVSGGEEAVALASHWLEQAADTPEPSAERVLSAEELAFAAALIDGVARPEDSAVSARALERLAVLAPELVPARLRSALRVGSTVGEALPWAVVPTARRVLRRMIGHLVADAAPARLGDTITRFTVDGARPTLELLGSPGVALGEADAARHRDGLRALIARDDVCSVSVKVGSVAADLRLWEFPEMVERVAGALTPLYELALPSDGPAAATVTAPGTSVTASGTDSTLLTLEADQYRYFDLAIAVLQRVLSNPALLHLEAAITLQADLPDALAALQRLHRWAAERVAAGGAPLTVRLVRSGDRAAERLDAALNGWPLATYADDADIDRNLARLLEWALTPERTDALHLVLADDDVFAIAFARLLAERRGCSDRLGFELPLGMPPALVEVVRRAVGAGGAGAGDGEGATGRAATGEEGRGTVRRRVPVLHSRDFAAASPYLRRLVDQLPSSPSTLSSSSGSALASAPVEERSARFLRSLAGLRPTWPERESFDVMDSILDSDEVVLDARPPRSNRTQDRTLVSGLVAPAAEGFTNAPVTDPSVPANREWARRIVERSAHSRLGVDTLSAARQRDALLAAGAAAAAAAAPGSSDGGSGVARGLAALVVATAEAGDRWGAAPVAERVAHLRRAALAVEANRDRLIEVLLSECGASFDAADADVSAAVDSATHYASLALDLEHIAEARHVPPALIVVVAEAGTPLATPADGVLRALAAGAAVILAPAPGARRASAVLVEALWESGIPRDALVLVDPAAPVPAAAPATLAPAAASPTQAPLAAEVTAAAPLSEAPEVAPPTQAPPAAEVTAAAPPAEAPRAIQDAEDTAWPAAQDAAPAGEEPLRHLVGHPTVDHVLLTGSRATAERFRSWRRDLSLFAETTAGYAIVVTPSADLDLAVADVATSAAHLALARATAAATSTSATATPTSTTPNATAAPADAAANAGAGGIADGGLVILVGSVAKSAHFARQLADASRSLHFAAPRIVHAATLDDAVDIQNAAPEGGLAGLQSLDPVEVEHWLVRMHAADLFVNRGITAPAPGRRPAGGGRSSTGQGVKAGGPNALLPFVGWRSEPGEESPGVGLAGVDAAVRELVDAATPGLDWQQFSAVRRGVLSDDEAWRSVFAATARDGTTHSHPERTAFRYRPVPVVIRLSDGEPLEHLVRVLAAGTRARASLGVSTSHKLPRPLRALLKERRVRVFVENDDDWLARVAKVGDGPSRIRLIGGDPAALAGVVGGSSDVAVFAGAVTAAGRLELLPFLTEQTVTITNHRFGGPSPLHEVRIG